MEERKRLNGYYNYTVVLTYLGMVSGFAGIIFAIGARIKLSVMCLMVAGLCDMFDGTMAATKQRDEKEKKFGIQYAERLLVKNPRNIIKNGMEKRKNEKD